MFANQTRSVPFGRMAGMAMAMTITGILIHNNTVSAQFPFKRPKPELPKPPKVAPPKPPGFDPPRWPKPSPPPLVELPKGPMPRPGSIPRPKIEAPEWTKTITIYRGVIYFGSGFSFDGTLKWDTTKGTVKANGKINFAISLSGQKSQETLVISEYEGRIVNGDTLEINRSIEGKSGLRVNSVLRLTPRWDGTIGYDFRYTAFNAHARNVAPQNGHKTGTIKVDKAPWIQSR